MVFTWTACVALPVRRRRLSVLLKPRRELAPAYARAGVLSLRMSMNGWCDSDGHACIDGIPSLMSVGAEAYSCQAPTARQLQASGQTMHDAGS